MKVQDYLDQQGISDVELAERLGRDVRGVRGMKSREIPKGWARQLGVVFDEDAAAVERERYVQGAKAASRAGDEPPTAPDPSKVERAALPAVVDPSVAQERIAALYGGIGFAVSQRTGNAGYAAVTDEQAPAIARAWVKAAEENEFARRVVALMGSGGTLGELAMAHVVWVMGLAYVSGRSDFDPLGSYRDRYAHYRPVVSDVGPGGTPEDFAGVGDDPTAAVG